MAREIDRQPPTDDRSHLRRAREGLVRLLERDRRPLSRQTLRTTIAILRAQQEATLDGILVIDREGRILSYNRRFLEIWGIPADAGDAGDDNELLGYAAERVVDWEAFIETVNHLYSHPHEVRTDTIALKDGRTLSRTTVPVISAGMIHGRAWYFRDITDAQKSEKLEAALFRIAQLTRESVDLDHFYRSLHHVISELMDATNFYVAEYDPVADVLTFPYFVDEFDTVPERRPPGRGLTSYVLRTGAPLLATPQLFEELVARGEVESIGAPSVDWLGAPLQSGGKTWGIIGVQLYDEGTRYTEREKEILVFVAQHVSAAIEQKRQEDAIRVSEQRYRQMFENNRAVQLVVDPEHGTIVDANMAACDFYGYSREELRRLHIWDVNVMSEESVRQEMENAARQERSYFIFRHALATGEVRDVEVHSGPIDGGGGRTLLYSIIHDITERKRTERALQQSEEKYRNIFDFASVGIYQSTRDGRFITANATLARMLGYEDVNELISCNLERDIYVDPAEREELIRVFAPRGLASDYELRWKRKDGRQIWVQLNAHAIRNADDSLFFEGFVYDVTERKEAEERLATSNAHRKAVLDAANRVSIIATDPDGTITVFNAGAESLLGYTAEEMVGRRSLLDLHLAAEVAAHAVTLAPEFGFIGGFQTLSARAGARGLEEREWTYMTRSGSALAMIVSVTAIRDRDGAVAGFLHVGTDVTETKKAVEQLRQQSTAMTASMDGIGILDSRLEFTYSNDALAKLFGFDDPRKLVGASLCDLYEPPEQVRFVTAIVPIVQHRGRWRGEATGVRRDGSTFPQEISLTAIDETAMVAVVRDITERTYAEEQIKHLAYHDALTALPNRLLFKDRVTVALSHAQRSEARLAVLFLDLDRFKVINDSLGHTTGDRLLQAVAARVASCVRDSDTVARLGGDEFTLLLPNLVRFDDVVPVAETLLEALRQPFVIDGRELFTSTSIGISLYPEDGADAETLIKNADTAMYQAKEQGRDNYQLFNAFVNARALQRIALEHALRRAVANDELEVYYQPIFDFRSARVTGMEALLRWNSSDFGPVTPSTFIPLAEAVGLMPSIGIWALRSACAQARQWHEAGYDDLTLAVNLSVTQLQAGDLVERVVQVLRETGLPPQSLELEITESGAMQSPEASLRMLQELKKLGIGVSLDDFGTGHSSLAYLRRFPIDTVKIDQSFVRDIGSDSDSAAIIIAIIAMAHSLRLKVIAEGVEHEAQMRFLRNHDCDQMQGYLLRAPLPASEFLDCIERQPGKRDGERMSS